MLKHLTIFAAVILLFSVQSSAQETKKSLTDKALLLYQQGKYEKAIETAEKVVGMEKQTQPPDAISYTNSLINAARMKQSYLIVLQNDLDDKNLNARDKIKIYEKNSRLASDIETQLREVIRLNDAGGRGQTAQTADVKSELAMLVQNYNPTAKPSIEATRGRIDDAEKLLTESLLTNEQIRGKDADQTLVVVLQAGDFYTRYVNFEKALPFYERYVQAVEKKGVSNYPDFSKALASYGRILFAGFQEKELAEAMKKRAALAPKKEEPKFEDFNLQARSKDAVAYASKVNQDFRTADENFKQKLKLQGKTLTRSALDASPKLIRVLVKIVVDENGKVIEAVADSKDEKLRARAEAEVSKWFVRPFSYFGVTQKMRGVIFYPEYKPGY